MNNFLPCRIDDLPEDVYHAMPCASSHALMNCYYKSPKHALIKKEPTESMKFGSYFHALILTPDICAETWSILPENANKASNKNREILIEWLIDQTDAPFIEYELPNNPTPSKKLDAKINALMNIFESQGRIIINQDDFYRAQRMRNSLMSKGIGEQIFAKGSPEVTVLAIDAETETLCKIRIDWLYSEDFIIDLKTTISLSASIDFEEEAGLPGANKIIGSWERDAAKYHYHIQREFYRYVWSLYSGKELPNFMHVIVETQEPYDCAFRVIDDASTIRSGQDKFRAALDIWSKCEKSGHWPGVDWDWNTGSYEIKSISLPKWA